MTPTLTLEVLFSTVPLVAETGTGKSLLSLKATENRSLWAAEAFHCSSTITGTQGCLVAPELGEALSPLHPSVNGALKAIWLFVAPGISPQVESRVSDEDSIGEENKWHMMGGGGAEMAVWELSSQPEQRKKEALRGILFITNAWRMFCMCMSVYFELIHTKLKWHPFVQGSIWKWVVFQQITSDFVRVQIIM